MSAIGLQMAVILVDKTVCVPLLLFPASASQYLDIYHTCECIVPGLKQRVQNSNHNCGVATFICGIDSAVKQQGKSDVYVRRFVNDCILAWL